MAVGTVRRTKERITVSLSPETRDYIARTAGERGTDQSAVVEDALRRMSKEERRKLTQATLLATADADRAEAEAWAAADPPPDTWPWEE